MHYELKKKVRKCSLPKYLFYILHKAYNLEIVRNILVSMLDTILFAKFTSIFKDHLGLRMLHFTLSNLVLSLKFQMHKYVTAWYVP